MVQFRTTEVTLPGDELLYVKALQILHIIHNFSAISLNTFPRIFASLYKLRDTLGIFPYF